MQSALASLPFLLLLACQSPEKASETTTIVRAPGSEKDAPEIAIDENAKLIRGTERNVNTYEELRLQGQTQQMEAVRDSIARSVDDHFDVFDLAARTADTSIVRNMAVKCLPFAIERRADARKTLLVLCTDRDMTILSNAALGLGILRDKDTDLTPVVALLGHGNTQVRTNAAAALMRLFLIKETPRRLTPQYITAMDRLVTMMHDPASIRSRRAAAWALANMRHIDTMAHLVSALQDEDEQVQIGGLVGLKRLGDQRGLEPVLQYLEGGPTKEAASWARQALEVIVIQMGLAQSAGELRDLGTNPRTWRKFIRAARMGGG
ncbi:MAG: HEAT repeat domain-containing protein [Planctomycetota bacterium]